jgi:hypothetical protein
VSFVIIFETDEIFQDGLGKRCVLRFNMWTKEEVGETIVILHNLIMKACAKATWIVEAFVLWDPEKFSEPFALTPLSSPKMPRSEERVGIPQVVHLGLFKSGITTKIAVACPFV